MGHDDELDLAGVDPARAKLRGEVLAGLERGAGEPRLHAAEVRRGLGGDRRVKPRVDEERARSWGGGSGTPGRGPSTTSSAACRRPAIFRVSNRPPVPLEEPVRELDLADAQRLDGHGRPGLSRPAAARSAASRRHAPSSLARVAARRGISSAPRMAEPSRIFRPGLARRAGLRRLRSRHRPRQGDARSSWRGSARRWSAAGAGPSRSRRRSAEIEAAGGTGSAEAIDIRDEEAVDALRRRRARAPRPPRHARQQRRRPVPEPGRGDHARRAFAR